MGFMFSVEFISSTTSSWCGVEMRGAYKVYNQLRPLVHILFTRDVVYYMILMFCLKQYVAIDRNTSHPYCVTYVERIGPIITDSLFPTNIRATEGNNINGPSLISVPEWIENRLGDYYLYFSHHRGQYIRLAYANNVSGPYSLHTEGVSMKSSIVYNHIASPDVHIDNSSHSIVMYFHTLDKSSGHGQYTHMAVSHDGLHFEMQAKDISRYYFRRFNALGEVFGMSPNNDGDGSRTFSLLHRSRHSERYRLPTNMSFFPRARHIFVHPIADNTVVALYSMLFEAPERVYCSQLRIVRSKTRASDCPYAIPQKRKNVTTISDRCNYVWVTLGEQQTVLFPSISYEGGGLPITHSKNGVSREFAREIRDPYVFVDRSTDTSYLLYTIGGEKGIALAKIQFVV